MLEEVVRWDRSRCYRRVLDSLAGARFVLIGEASHGTSEFYAERARITQRLIEEAGFDAVAAEADWPDAFRAGCYARGLADESVEDVLRVFDRFPRWMWANREVADFLAWLRAHNERRAMRDRTAFYGLDLYSLDRSMEAVVSYLDEVDPAAASRARDRYGCFDRFGDETTEYARAALYEDCEDEVVAQLLDMRSRHEEYASRDGLAAEDAAFFARQNAIVVRNAEEYYRGMFRGGVHTWNLRDRHMFETLGALDEHLSELRGRPARIVVWAHNSHLGDARATAMSRRGELNLGQLVRERWKDEATNIGLTTYSGTVVAADDWGGQPRLKRVRRALAGSYEAFLHDVGGDFAIDLRTEDAASALAGPRLQRAIGVVYLPHSERLSHYFEARLPQQFDWVVHLDETNGVRPLGGAPRSEEDLPETYPSGV